LKPIDQTLDRLRSGFNQLLFVFEEFKKAVAVFDSVSNGSLQFSLEQASE